MPAYKQSIDTQCQWEPGMRCAKRARWTVYDTTNGLRGRYCTRHAEHLVRDLNAPLRTPSAPPGDEGG